MYSTSEYKLSDLWLLSYVHFFVVVLSQIAKGGDVFYLVRGSAYLFLYVHRSCDHVYIHCAYLWYIYDDVFFSFTYPFMCCLFSFFIHMLLIYLYAILLFCFTQRCLDEFCLKCFRYTGCQSLLAINSLLAKFFKSLY